MSKLLFGTENRGSHRQLHHENTKQGGHTFLRLIQARGRNRPGKAWSCDTLNRRIVLDTVFSSSDLFGANASHIIEPFTMAQ